MAELKTKQTDDSVTVFLNSVEDEKKRKKYIEHSNVYKKRRCHKT